MEDVVSNLPIQDGLLDLMISKIAKFRVKWARRDKNSDFKECL